MKQHKYKAIRTDGKGWVFGSLIEFTEKCKFPSESDVFSNTWIMNDNKKVDIDYMIGGASASVCNKFIQVIPETVCEFVVHHNRGIKGMDEAIEFDIYTGDVLWVASIGELVCGFDERELVYDFTNIESGVNWSYQDVMEDIERVVRNVHDEEVRE